MKDEGRTEQQTSPMADTSTSSYQQELERQNSVEVSSTRPHSKQQIKQGADIKRTFTEIKVENEPIRIQIYNQLLKMAPTN